jgi:hypothetical protein
MENQNNPKGCKVYRTPYSLRKSLLYSIETMPGKLPMNETGHKVNNSYIPCDWCSKELPSSRYVKHLLTTHFEDLFDKKNDTKGNPKYSAFNRNSVLSAKKQEPVILRTLENVYYCCLACQTGTAKLAMCELNHFCEENNHTKDHLAACKQLKERIEHPESYVPPKRTRSKKQPGQSVETPIASPTPTEPLPVREIVRTSLTEEQQDDLLSILADANIDYNKQAKKLILADYANDLLKKTLQAATEQAERDNKVIAMMREKLRTICPDTDCPRHFDIQEEMIVRDATVSNTSYMHIMDKLNTKIMNKSDDIILDDKHKSNIIEKNVDLLRSVGVSEDTLDLYI